MKKTFLYLVILMLMSSCATIMNRKTTKIEIHTLPDSAKLVFSADSVITTPVRLQVPRSYNDFKVEFIHDSIHKPVVFKSKIAPEVWGNLVFLSCSPVGFMVDIYSKKRIFSYRKDILVDLTSDPPKIKQWYPDQTGKFFLTAKIPGFNFLKLDTGSATGNYSMLSGILLGVDYYYKRRSYLSAGFGFTGAVNSDYPILGKQIADSSGRMIPDTFEKATSFIFKINNNHDFKYASIGYGLNLSDYLYSKPNFR